MHDFNYSYVKHGIDKKVKLLFTDTADNLVYEIETNDVYEDFYKNKDMFNFSEYSENLKFYDATKKNKKKWLNERWD